MLLKEIIENQGKWCAIVTNDKKRQRLLKTILNRKYKSKGNRSEEQIKQDLLDAGFTLHAN